MALTATTLYEALESHVVSVAGVKTTVRKGELRLGASPETTAETLWIPVGKSEAEKMTARVAAGLPAIG